MVALWKTRTHTLSFIMWRSLAATSVASSTVASMFFRLRSSPCLRVFSTASRGRQERGETKRSGWKKMCLAHLLAQTLPSSFRQATGGVKSKLQAAQYTPTAIILHYTDNRPRRDLPGKGKKAQTDRQFLGMFSSTARPLFTLLLFLDPMSAWAEAFRLVPGRG